MAKVAKSTDFIMCEECSKLFDPEDFYEIGHGKYAPICKECSEKLILNSDGSLGQKKFKDYLKRIDVAFKYEAWAELGSGLPPYVESYLKLIKSNKKKIENFTESDTAENNETMEEEEALLKKWGVKTMEDVEFLEENYHEWATSYEIDSKAMVDSVMQLCLIDLDIRRARSKGNVTDLNSLIKAKSQILGDANLKPVQETGNAANEQMGIGLLIKKLEQERPVPEDTEPDWIDEMKLWIVGQLARMEGLQTDVTDDFNKELAKYGMGDELDHIGDDLNA